MVTGTDRPVPRRSRCAEAGAPAGLPPKRAWYARPACCPAATPNILNISNTGLLVENKTRLPVGSTVNVRVQGSVVMGIEGHIVRSRVSAIHRDGSLTYETAIEFERPQPIDGERHLGSAGPRGRAARAAPSGDDDVYVIDTSNDW